jgi:divalent metal cation (Fe/Co/Zn/Cd) transporter
VLTMQLGPDEVLVTVDIRFQPGLDVRELEHVIAKLEGRIKQAEPKVQRIFLEPGALKNISRNAA